MIKQDFTLHIATDTLEYDAQQLGVTMAALESICVTVSAAVVRQPTLYLQLTYRVSLSHPILADKLHWPTWQAAQVGFHDYLWQETCLECFIAGRALSDSSLNPARHDASDNANTHYIEINASPDGRYALYQFINYRRPATQPPLPLLHPKTQTRAFIQWFNNPKIPLTSAQTSSASYDPLERSIGIPLTELPHHQYAIHDTAVDYLHPCVILYLDNTPLYFAPRHAAPPDFHDRQYWSTVTL